MRGSTAYGASCAPSTKSLLAGIVRVLGNLTRVPEGRVLFLGMLAAETLGLLHRVLLFLVLRLGLARCVLHLAGLDELLRALVVILRAAIAAFAFHLLLVRHNTS